MSTLPEQTSRTNTTEALRAEFQRRGWSITMSDNGQSVLDPFPVVAALAALATVESPERKGGE